MGFRRVEHYLSFSSGVHPKELPLDAGGHGKIAVRQKRQRPDVGLLRIVEDGSFPLVRIHSIDLPVGRSADVERPAVEGQRVDFGLRRGVDQLHLAPAEAIQLPVVSGAEEAISVRRGNLRQHEWVSERGQLLERGSRPQLASGRDGKSLDIAGQKIFCSSYPPELRADGKDIGCKTGNQKGKAKAHGSTFRSCRFMIGRRTQDSTQIFGFTSRSIFTAPSTM